MRDGWLRGIYEFRTYYCCNDNVVVVHAKYFQVEKGAYTEVTTFNVHLCTICIIPKKNNVLDRKAKLMSKRIDWVKYKCYLLLFQMAIGGER